MYRQNIMAAATNGGPFLHRLRCGLVALDEEVDKLETITNASTDLDNLMPAAITYFDDQLRFLQNVPNFRKEAEELHKTFAEKIPTLDDVEGELCRIRQQLLELEQDPKVLARGYRPFRPVDSVPDTQTVEEEELLFITNVRGDTQIDGLAMQRQESVQFLGQVNGDRNHRNGTTVIETPPSNNETVQPKKLDILASVKKSARKYPERKIPGKTDNPLLARGLALCQKWIKYAEKQEPEGSSTVTNSNVTPVAPNKSHNKQALLSASGKKTNQKIVTPKIQTLQEEYETVEFTPGMTTKIRKSHEKPSR